MRNIIIVSLLLLASCGGGSAIIIDEQPALPISGVGHPADVVDDQRPPEPPGTPLGDSVAITLTITRAAAGGFDVYCWNDALQQYTFFWQFNGGTETFDALYTPGKQHEIHTQRAGVWTRYDLVAGQTTLAVE